MIAAIDIGNTRTKFALFAADGSLTKEGALPTSEEFLRTASAFFPESIDRVVIGSVVPARTPEWADFLMGRSNLLHVAGFDSPWGFRLGIEQPASVGIDRLANLEGALKTPGAVLVVDAGTATKFDLLEGVAPRTFPGGAIAPGMQIAYEALLARGAQLPPIDLGKFSPVVGYNTETAIRSGVLYGFAAQVDGMVARIFEERGHPPAAVIATGGNSGYLQGRARLITHYRPKLTLEGLHELAKKI